MLLRPTFVLWHPPMILCNVLVTLALLAMEPVANLVFQAHSNPPWDQLAVIYAPYATLMPLKPTPVHWHLPATPSNVPVTLATLGMAPVVNHVQWALLNLQLDLLDVKCAPSVTPMPHKPTLVH